MKRRTRILAMLLTLVMALPLFGVTALAATPAVYATHDFEGLTDGKRLTTSDGHATVTPYSTVKKETVSGKSNTYVRVPFVGGESSSATSNWDKSIQVNHSSLKDAKSVTFEVDYRPHYGGSGSPTLEAQFRIYKFTDANGTAQSGHFYNLFIINVNNGSLKNCGTLVSGAKGMVMDQWNTLKLVLDTSNGHYSIYINGALYAVQDAPKMVSTSWGSFYGCKDLKVDANNFIVAKCNKNAGAYTATEASNTSYVDVDNVRIYETPVLSAEIDGKKISFESGAIADLTVAGKTFAYASVQKKDGTTTRITSPELPLEDGMKITTCQIGMSMDADPSARLGSPTGLRFVTTLNAADLAAIRANEDVESVKLGTLIAPYLTLAANSDFNKADFADVPATVEKWYAEDSTAGTVSFAGSIANIKEENYNREFAAVGYVELTLQDGQVLTVYAKASKTAYPRAAFAATVKTLLETDKTLSDAEKRVMQKYADAYTGDFETMYKKDFEGLNVLAIGDSLFTGTDATTPQSKQWTNVLGQKYGWNLTNLGVGGASITYKEGQGNFSMYRNLFYTPSYKFGSSNTDYFSCGDPSGDPNDVDLILLQGGSNDYGPKVAAPIGKVGSTNPAEFLGAWKLMVDKLLDFYPNATVVMMTAWENNDQSARVAIDGMNAITFTSSVKTLYAELYAENERVRLIDSGSPAVSGVNMRDSAWRSEYSHDSFHLNEKGMNVMAERMLPLIWDIVRQIQK